MTVWASNWYQGIARLVTIIAASALLPAPIATQEIPHTVPFFLPSDETFGAGDTRTPVNDQKYQVPFAFNGTIDNVTFKLGPVRLSAAEQRQLNRMVALGAE